VPASAAQPPTEWTRVEPAKSEKPSSLSQPPPHCQAPVIGYMIPVRTAENSRKGHTPDALGERTRGDRGRGRDEHHLEEPVRGCGIAAAEVGALLGQRRAVVGRPDGEAAEPAAVDAIVHQVVADQVEQDAGDRVHRDVLE
jgi:hypothetical protein